MNNKSFNKLANQLKIAFLRNKIINPLPSRITKKLKIANTVWIKKIKTKELALPTLFKKILS